MDDAPALSVRGLSRSYGGLLALAHLDLAIAPGECVALLGRNGSGKTTAVRVIAGLLAPSSGSVEVCGANMHVEPQAILARSRLAAVPDSPLLYGDLSVGEHLELVALAHGAAGDDLDARIDAQLTRFELADRRGARPGELSRGMRQKLALACALIRPFSVLLLDEPVVGLDPAAQHTLQELLLAAKGEGVAVLLTTHQLAFARGIADSAILLSDGKVVDRGEYARVIEGEWVHEWGLR